MFCVSIPSPSHLRFVTLCVLSPWQVVGSCWRWCSRSLGAGGVGIARWMDVIAVFDSAAGVAGVLRYWLYDRRVGVSSSLLSLAGLGPG